MRLGIEIMVHVLLLSLGCLVGAQFAGVQSGILQARSDFYTYLEQIEYSEMDAQQISRCQELAQKKGYQLTYTELLTLEEENTVLQFSMHYPIRFLLPGMEAIEEEGVICGYVR